MLARWPIQFKLLLALAILTATVTTLALSGFWGLYGYRSLATAISQRADELPLTSSLTRNAETLRDTCHRIRTAKLDEALNFRDALFPSVVINDESERFVDALVQFRAALDRYEERLDQRQASDSFGPLEDRPRKVAASLRQRLELIEALVRPRLWEIDRFELAILLAELDGLAEESEELPRLLQHRMAGFRDQTRGQYRTLIVLAWSCTIAAAGLLAALLILFRKLVLRPFRTLMAGCRRVARGEFDHRIDLGTGDELAELAGAMNGMTDRFQRTYRELKEVCDDLDQQVRERSRQAVRQEQLASVGFLAAGVAHEINNPLASIAWSAEALEGRLHELIHDVASPRRPLTSDEADALRSNLRRIQEEAFRCKGITERLLDFSRLGDVRRAPTDLTELVEDVVTMVGTIGQYRCKTIRIDCPSRVRADVNPQEIRQVVLNLLTNALESVGTDGGVDVRVRQVGDVARITVEDDGCGMDEEVREHLFEPFFTRRRDGRGTGLGLSISYRIVSHHGGQITAHSDGPGCGSRLEVTLPLEASDIEDERRQAA